MPCDATAIDDLLLSPKYVENPYPTYELLRRDSPVYWRQNWKRLAAHEV
jgi:hypothetical protein